MAEAVKYRTQGNHMVAELRERMARTEAIIGEMRDDQREVRGAQKDIAEDVKEILSKISYSEGVDSEKDKQEAREHRKTKVQSGGIAAGIVTCIEAAIHWLK